MRTDETFDLSDYLSVIQRDGQVFLAYAGFQVHGIREWMKISKLELAKYACRYNERYDAPYSYNEQDVLQCYSKLIFNLK